MPDLVMHISPAVVSIAATAINPYQVEGRVIHSAGSGFLFDPKGLIFTNAHVAYGFHLIRVTLADGATATAQLIGADPLFDLAVLRIPPPPHGEFPIVVLGDSDRLRVGEDVLAIGNPLGLDQSVTRGIVSRLDRPPAEAPFARQKPWIQTDTPINAGNSGGPLVNRCGEVIGITTAALDDAQNIGFAMPINLAQEVLPSLLTHGRVRRPWVGFHGQLIDETLRGLLRGHLPQGLLVEAIEPESPAERAGLRGGQLELVIAGHTALIGGDIITHLNGIYLTSPDALSQAMQTLRVGSTLRLRVFRDGKSRAVTYVLPARPLLPGDLMDWEERISRIRRSVRRSAP
jgi:S1-C subfamily serine protease